MLVVHEEFLCQMQSCVLECRVTLAGNPFPPESFASPQVVQLNGCPQIGLQGLHGLSIPVLKKGTGVREHLKI